MKSSLCELCGGNDGGEGSNNNFHIVLYILDRQFIDIIHSEHEK